ncbi:MAG: MBL fold metallo-hydrolase [Dyadobacter sp.]|uniref:MBL fold metallo-hydrolase n=1 Tax=Dyadobacter sp. TaxID=1914288 RepID=UPI001B1D711A|nr:MBL fold metallo-hydrolase [Dyadobacter sp.]MBO9616425.1 MBL fold metallo-hydrolase [Dyadobacter sp.]
MQTQDFITIESEVLSLEVFNASENSFGVASVIVSGKTDAVLIDAQFTLAEAEKVANRIKVSNKNLKAIFVSHGDPDFYFGLEVFKKHFPQVTAYAAASTVEHIKATAQKKLDVWGQRLGKALTSNVVLPQILIGENMELEGNQLQVIGLESFPGRTFIWIPSLKAVVGGINVFGNHFNAWMADAQTPDARSLWIAILDQITSMQPQIVVPAHGRTGDALDLTSVQHTKSYVEFYEQALKNNKTSQELIEAITAEFPGLSFETALQIGAKVNTGEMKW